MHKVIRNIESVNKDDDYWGKKKKNGKEKQQNTFSNEPDIYKMNSTISATTTKTTAKYNHVKITAANVNLHKDNEINNINYFADLHFFQLTI